MRSTSPPGYHHPIPRCQSASAPIIVLSQTVWAPINEHPRAIYIHSQNGLPIDGMIDLVEYSCRSLLSTLIGHVLFRSVLHSINISMASSGTSTLRPCSMRERMCYGPKLIPGGTPRREHAKRETLARECLVDNGSIVQQLSQPVRSNTTCLK